MHPFTIDMLFEFDSPLEWTQTVEQTDHTNYAHVMETISKDNKLVETRPIATNKSSCNL